MKKKMKKAKKIISLIILFLFLIPLFSCSSSETVELSDTKTQDNLTYYIYHDTISDSYYAKTYEYNGSSSLVTILDTLEYNNIDVPVTEVLSSTFVGNNNVEKIVIGSNIEKIEERSFMSLKSLKEVVLNDKLTKLSDYLFSRSTIKSIVLPENITKICDAAFLRSSLESITILNNTIEIGQEVFLHCDSLTCVYFKGTQEEFSSLKMSYGNDLFKNATLYLYSEEYQSGCWHFVDNTPTLWA